MKKSPINMYRVPIRAIYKIKSSWSDWLKFRIPMPKIVTPFLLKNLLGGYNETFYKRFKK